MFGPVMMTDVFVLRDNTNIENMRSTPDSYFQKVNKNCIEFCLSIQENLKWKNTRFWYVWVAEKVDLSSLKSWVVELGVDKLNSDLNGLSKLRKVPEKKLLKRLNLINWLKKLVLLVQTNKIMKKDWRYSWKDTCHY